MLRAVGSMKITQTTVRNRYDAYTAKLPSLNTDEMRRLVGYLEYSRSLSLLDPLVTGATTDELRMMDQIVASRDEFTVYTNLSRRIPKKAVSSLDEPAADGTSSGKRGLAWVMALARVELGAMVAGFTDRRESFATVPPTRFERQAYGEMLLDGTRTHYWSLGNDPVVTSYLSFRNRQITDADRERGRAEIDEAQAIAYGRRAALAREFVRAIQAFGRGEFTPQQVAELAAWERELGGLVDTIAYKVLGLGDTSIASSKTSVSTNSINQGALMRSCPFLRCDNQNRPVGATIVSDAPGQGANVPAKTGPGATAGTTSGSTTPSSGASRPTSPAKTPPGKEKSKK
jgi:hypothetical protein